MNHQSSIENQQSKAPLSDEQLWGDPSPATCGGCLWFVPHDGAIARGWGYCIAGERPNRGGEYPRVQAGQRACREGLPGYEGQATGDGV